MLVQHHAQPSAPLPSGLELSRWCGRRRRALRLFAHLRRSSGFSRLKSFRSRTAPSQGRFTICRREPSATCNCSSVTPGPGTTSVTLARWIREHPISKPCGKRSRREVRLVSASPIATTGESCGQSFRHHRFGSWIYGGYSANQVTNISIGMANLFHKSACPRIPPLSFSRLRSLKHGAKN
jgi:hypothetical protein